MHMHDKSIANLGRRLRYERVREKRNKTENQTVFS